MTSHLNSHGMLQTVSAVVGDENGQCMLKIKRKNHALGVVMTNRDSEVLQEESGVEKLVERD